MKTHVLTGSKAEITEALARMDGVIREVMVFVEEPADTLPPPLPGENIFAEMEPHMVHIDDFVDDSREGIYTRMESD